LVMDSIVLSHPDLKGGELLHGHQLSCLQLQQ
jgi:hypothetical protein